MGSFLARTYLIRYPGTVAGAILMGTGRCPRRWWRRAASWPPGRPEGGDRHSSPLVNKLAFEAYNQKFAPNRTGYDWLSASTENVDQYLADPLCGGDPTIGLFREMLRGSPALRSKRT
ncbi:MAG: serine aminopeptidase domain-containing protein [Dysosmobacter welbionis]